MAQLDKAGEEWRHLCEVRAVLKMPVDRRRAYMELVTKKRGLEAGQRLRTDVYHAWVESQVAALEKMEQDEREDRLWRIECSSTARMRADVEAALAKAKQGAQECTMSF